MRIGIAHHYGWAIAVMATADHRVADRRRIELVGPDLPAAPIHHEGGTHEMHRHGPLLDDDALASLVRAVRASVVQATGDALDELEAASAEPIESISVRGWPDDFPVDVAVLRHPPYESRADSVMYCQILADLARQRGWAVHCYDAGNVEAAARRVLGDRGDDVLVGPRSTLGPPWAKDHRTALAATVLAGSVPAGEP
jgi:hypothetical protein